jgi:hypothetical protein
MLYLEQKAVRLLKSGQGIEVVAELRSEHSKCNCPGKKLADVRAES